MDEEEKDIPLTAYASRHSSRSPDLRFPGAPGIYEQLETSASVKDGSDVEGPSLRKFAIKAFVTISVFLVLTILLEHFAEKEVREASEKLIDCIGLPGIWLLVFVSDGFPQPFTYVPLIFMAVKSSVSKTKVFLLCASASYVAAVLGYWIGYNLRLLKCGGELIDKICATYPFVPDIMARKGALGVAIAALMPMPLAIATWTAGSFRISFLKFLLSACCRSPKILIFVLLSRGPSGTDPAARGG